MAINSKFFRKKQEFLTIAEILKLTNAKLEDGKENHLQDKIYEVSTLDQAIIGEISFIHSSSYLPLLKDSKASYCFVDCKYLSKKPKNIIALICDDPYFAYSQLILNLYEENLFYQTESANNAIIGKNVTIMPNVYIGKNVTIGDNVTIDANSFIGDNVTIGNNCTIKSLCNISFANIGNNCFINTGVKIGQDGFGYVHNKGVNHKILQLGIVEIGNFVDIGANSCVDRGAIGNTIINDQVKLDNLVQIAHNVEIGIATVIAGCSAVAGSSKIGRFVQIGGHVAVSGHLKVGDGAKIAGKSGVTKDVAPMQAVAGVPSVPIKDWHRAAIKMQ
ncbi:UDP-3-O-(3-hydroxymyristoyl)glucosamine N-acyltransferase, partial [Rickettsiales bacterium]|nr:UDP-3-O-(3-hydroxymyristoyl)glucosamine N-acyltransferase [Rickettsiales bacterium]